MATKTKKAATKTKKGRNKFPRSKCNPFREGSNYATGFDVLFQLARKKMILKSTVLKAYMKESKLDATKAAFNLSVLISPTSDGACHKSAAKASLRYFVKRANGLVQLVIRDNAQA